MMMRLRAVRTLFVIAVAVASSSLLSAQRLATRPSSAGISGTVISDDSESRPLRRVRVQLESGLLELPRSVATDDAGRFSFPDLPAGNYTLSATKPGYVAVSYGAKTAGERPGIAIAVRDGQRVDNLAIRLPRGAVLTGTIRQPGGQPAANLSVTVTAVRTLGGVRRSTALAGIGSAQTDDRGVYRVFGLAAGEYLVQVRAQAFQPTAAGGRRVTPEQIAWAERAAANASAAPAAPTNPAPGPAVVFAPVYYPGTTDAASAAIVSVTPGEERTGLDFTIDYAAAARISGTIVGPDGRAPQRVQVGFAPTTADPGNPLSALMDSLAGRRVDYSGGAFTANYVAPGRYLLTARAADNSADSGSSTAVMPLGGLFGGGGGTPYTLWAQEEIQVSGRDISDLVLRLQPGMAMSGRIVVQATTLPPPDVTTLSVNVSTVPAEGVPAELAMISMFGGGGGGTSSGQVSKEGTFEIKGIAPGRYRVMPVGPGMLPIAIPGVQVPNTWAIASILIGGRDVLDRPLEIRPNESFSDVTITITDRVAELSGTVFDQAGRPTAAFPIVAFPTDREYWAPGSRRITQSRPASDGKYRMTGLPPGEYYLCAATDLDPNDLADPLFLEQLIAGSFKITIAVGEKKVQDIKLAGG